MEHTYSCVVVTSNGKQPFMYTSNQKAGSRANIEDAILQYKFENDYEYWCEVEKHSIYRVN